MSSVIHKSFAGAEQQLVTQKSRKITRRITWRIFTKVYFLLRLRCLTGKGCALKRTKYRMIGQDTLGLGGENTGQEALNSSCYSLITQDKTLNYQRQDSARDLTEKGPHPFCHLLNLISEKSDSLSAHESRQYRCITA